MLQKSELCHKIDTILSSVSAVKDDKNKQQKTRACTCKTLRPRHMLAPKDGLEMSQNLDEAHIGKGP